MNWILWIIVTVGSYPYGATIWCGALRIALKRWPDDWHRKWYYRCRPFWLLSITASFLAGTAYERGANLISNGVVYVLLTLLGWWVVKKIKDDGEKRLAEKRSAWSKTWDIG